MNPRALRHTLATRQNGAALIVTLIVLMLITMLAVTSFRLGKGNLQIVGNMQQRNQAFVAAQGAVEQVISSLQFTQTPANSIPAPCGGVANTTCVDVNGDGTADVNVTVTNTCVQNYVIQNSQLSWSSASDQACLASVNSESYSVSGSPTGNSLCANTVWDTQATATDALTSAQYVIDEGTSVRVPASTTCP
jgi:Tfp pilus assembly protein PilX